MVSLEYFIDQSGPSYYGQHCTLGTAQSTPILSTFLLDFFPFCFCNIYKIFILEEKHISGNRFFPLMLSDFKNEWHENISFKNQLVWISVWNTFLFLSIKSLQVIKMKILIQPNYFSVKNNYFSGASINFFLRKCWFHLEPTQIRIWILLLTSCSY